MEGVSVVTLTSQKLLDRRARRQDSRATTRPEPIEQHPFKNQLEIVRLLASRRTIQIDFCRHWFVAPSPLELILLRADRKTFARTQIYVCIFLCGRPPKNYN